MLSVQRARALVAIFAFLCAFPIQYVQANTCDPDFDSNCVCDDYVFERNCRFVFHRRSTASIIAGAVVAGLALIALIVALFIWKRRHDQRVARSQAIHAAASSAAFAGTQSAYPTTYQPPATYNNGQANTTYPGQGSPYAGQGAPYTQSGASYYSPPPGPPGAPGAPEAAHLQGNQSPPTAQNPFQTLPSPYEK
ncbi:hypothetical protein VKT23_002812 [Stygiomarasmius scandens]|uniref:Uncharacterized protein n=1 Tax=Marasmiellus scandens TaxID=2682957 RepID=A0ABR1JWT3_9AGAR